MAKKTPVHGKRKSTGNKGKTSQPAADPGAQPVFAQPKPSADPTGFKNPVTDQRLRGLTSLGVTPQAVGGAEPILTLAEVYGSEGALKSQAIQDSGQIVFHSVGDTGSVVGPATQSLVADKMLTDFTEANPADIPSFFFHLGDLVYYFGEATYYYDQFFEPYRDYPGPILAIAGNHDGVVYSRDPQPTLDSFLRNFCSSAGPVQSPDAGGLFRTTMIQPGVYFTLEAPFLRILALYSNVLEDPGVISDENGSNNVLDERQVTFLTAALARVKSDNFAGAVIIAVHHPPFTGGSEHGGSPIMLQDIDRACQTAGVWPHAVFSGHSHNYQRFTRKINDLQIPFLVAGCGGHSPLSSMRTTYRTPYKIDDTLTLESYDDTDYGYLRVIVTSEVMRVEFHPQGDGGVTKTPDDVVTVTLANHTVS